VPLFYADASALVKLVRTENETSALRAYIDGADLVASELVLAEVPRAVRRAADDDPVARLDVLLDTADAVLRAVAFTAVDSAILRLAGAIPEPALRALDAIHVAAAVDVSPIDAFVTYDQRQAAAARLAGFRTVAPGS
jgi:predicted nucleic acid-binding protein